MVPVAPVGAYVLGGTVAFGCLLGAYDRLPGGGGKRDEAPFVPCLLRCAFHISYGSWILGGMNERPRILQRKTD